MSVAKHTGTLRPGHANGGKPASKPCLPHLTGRERWRYRLFLALLYPIAILPMWLLYRVADVIYFFLAYVLKYRRKVVRRNLRNSFPEMSAAELQRTERDFYRNLADCVVETVKLLCVSDRTLRRRVKVTNGELVDRIAAGGKPIILFLAHYGNWEWMPAMTYYYSPHIFNGHIYKKLHDTASEALMLKVRGRFPSHGFELMNSVREILRVASEYPAMMVGFISDHRFNGEARKQSTRFLNQDTPYYIGGEAIGRKIGAEFLYLDVRKERRGHYEITFVPIVPDPEDHDPNPITRGYYKLLEQTIRRRPGPWLWSHKRWV